MLNQPWADKSTTPMVLVHVHRFPNKQNHTRAIYPNETNCPHTIHPNGINRPCAILSSETVGAAPVCPPERPHSGVSIPKYICASRIMYADLTMDAPLQGDTGGHTGTAPTHLHQTTQCVITSSHCTFDSSRQSHGVFIPHRIAHSIAPNRTVCPYPIGVILSIAQGWQVQRGLP